MAETNYEDSQESQRSVEMFGEEDERPIQANVGEGECCNVCRENNSLIKDILKELKEIREKMQSQQTDSKIICVEKSALERPLIEYLKGRFVRDIFLSSPDTELKNKVMSLQRRLNLKEDFAVIFRVCLKYASRKMTDFRGQVKAKIVSVKPDVGNLPLPEFQQRIFGKFIKGVNGDLEEQNAIMIRSFCHEQKIFPKFGQNIGKLDFWGDFKSYRDTVLNDDMEGKWEKMRGREEKRIERYQRLSQ
nr:uncharacterized protein LOC111116197 isoform X2 [Crassostrea virginica]